MQLHRNKAFGAALRVVDLIQITFAGFARDILPANQIRRGKWLERTDPNVDGTFSCVAKVGDDGPGIEMPLLAAEMAFSDAVASGANTGFLRDDALLALVILTDEDDCSQERREVNELMSGQCARDELTSVDRHLAFFDNLKDQRERWAAAVIAGPTSCTSANGDAAKANRLLEFIDKTGPNGVFSSICQSELSGALQDALETFEAACESFPIPQ